MKRKYIRELADFIEKGRGPIDMADSTKCLAAQVLRFNGARKVHFTTSHDIGHALGVGPDTAHEMYAAWHIATRKVLAAALRYMARTGKADAFDTIRGPAICARWE